MLGVLEQGLPVSIFLCSTIRSRVSLDRETSADRALNARCSRIEFRCRLSSRNSSRNDTVTRAIGFLTSQQSGYLHVLGLWLRALLHTGVCFSAGRFSEGGCPRSYSPRSLSRSSCSTSTTW